MKSKKVTLGVAGACVLGGAVGLAVLAAPAGAGPAPSLPSISPQALVQSVITAKPVALSGTVELDNELGLPSVPGMQGARHGIMQLLGDGKTDFQVAEDANGRGKISMPSGNTQQTLIDDGKKIWLYDSTDRSVVTWNLPSDGGRAGLHAMQIDPATTAQQTLADVQNTSDITVDGTASVAGRKAYDLVVTPKPNQRTLVREVRVAIDSDLRVPLRMQVYGDGSSAPALQIGFTSLTVGAPEANQFQFTPPPGSKVTDGSDNNAGQAAGSIVALHPNLVGHGWDAVITAKLPEQTPSDSGQEQPNRGAEQTDPEQLLARIGKPVSGPWGDGWIAGSKVGTVLITSDGRVAAGLVPEQVLTDVIGSVK